MNPRALCAIESSSYVTGLAVEVDR
jgi:hypothetical protein